MLHLNNRIFLVGTYRFSLNKTTFVSIVKKYIKFVILKTTIIFKLNCFKYLTLGNCDVTQPSDDMSWMTSASTMHMMTLSTMRNNSAVMSPEQIIPPASLNDVVVTLGDIKPSR